jgi:Uma2 family endonuclease
MAQIISPTELSIPFKLNVQRVRLTEEQFERLCQENPDLRIELSAQGELVIMPLTGLETGRKNTKITQNLANWSDADGTGVVFDSSTLFTLPNGAKRSPDASWVRKERWDALPPKERSGAGLLCPDFVVELRSPSDQLAELQEKMLELLNGARLGWLIDPLEKKVYIYRPGQPPEELGDPPTVSGGPVLPGFVLELRELW